MDLFGFSIAGIETCIEVPSLKLALDLGRCSRTSVLMPVVVVSHGHLDHIGAIAQHAARRSLMHMPEGTYIVPSRIHERVEALFNAAGALDGKAIPRRVVPLELGEEFPIGGKRVVRSFETFHRVPSQGYTVWERRNRLRDEFRALPPAKLGELRRQGVTLEESYEAPLLSFTGDTRVEVLEQCAELQQTQTLVIEASFLDQRVSVADAREMGHIHLDELLERAELLPKQEIVLSHFSARYDDDEVKQIIANRLPDELRASLRILPKSVTSK